MLDLTYEPPKPKIIQGAQSDWELVIGLEVHAQVSSNAKLFSGASTSFGAEPNSQANVVDLGLPGTLPVLNKSAVHKAINQAENEADKLKRSVRYPWRRRRLGPRLACT